MPLIYIVLDILPIEITLLTDDIWLQFNTLPDAIFIFPVLLIVLSKFILDASNVFKNVVTAVV